jgi:hypothetical protein
MIVPPNLNIIKSSVKEEDDAQSAVSRERSVTSAHPDEYSLQPTSIIPSNAKRQSTISTDMTIDEDREPSEQTQLRSALELVLGVAIESMSQLHAQRMDLGLKSEEQFKTLASIMGYKIEPISVSYMHFRAHNVDDTHYQTRPPYMTFPLEIMYRIMGHITDKATLARLTHLSRSFQREAERALYSEVLFRSHTLDPAPRGSTVLPFKGAGRKRSLWERVGPYILALTIDMRSQTGLVMDEQLETTFGFIQELLPNLKDCRSLTLHIPEIPGSDRSLKYFISPSFYFNVRNLRHFGTTLRVIENEVLRAIIDANPNLNSLSFGDLRYTFSLPSAAIPTSIKSISVRRHKYFLTTPQLESLLSMVQSRTESIRLDLSFDSETVLPPILGALRRAPALKKLILTFCTWNLMSVHFLERVTMYTPMVKYYGTMCVTCDLLNVRLFFSL